MIGDMEDVRCPECGLILAPDMIECPRCLTPLTPENSGPPMVERIYESELEYRAPAEKKSSGRIIMVLAIIVIVAILVISLSFYYLIPRVDLKVITVYKESSGVTINLDTKIQNEGTLDIQHFSMNITVLNSSQGIVAKGDYYLADLNPHSSHSFDNIYFIGDHYEDYHITIEINFESSGKDISDTYEHNVDEYMFLRFEDGYMQWGG
jgi:hypothetical protein